MQSAITMKYLQSLLAIVGGCISLHQQVLQSEIYLAQKHSGMQQSPWTTLGTEASPRMSGASDGWMLGVNMCILLKF